MFKTVNGGRIDTLVMLFTILSIWSIARFGDCDNRKKTHVFLSALFMMLSGVYPVPVVATLCAFQVAGSFRDRRALRREISIALTAAMGVLLAYLLCCIFYFCHRNLLWFVRTYFTFGVGSLAKCSSPLLRVVNNYLHDGIPFLCLAGAIGIGAAFLKIRFRQRLLWLLLWVASIPLVMTLAGRYEIYYRWLFVLPVMLVGIGMLERLNRKFVQCLVLGVVLSCSAVVLAGIIKARCRTFNSIRQLSCDIKDSHVVLADYLLYYHVVDSGNTLWRGGILPPRAKRSGSGYATLNAIVSDQKMKDRILKVVNRIEHIDKELPADGYLIGFNVESFNEVVSDLQRLGYVTEAQTNCAPLLRARLFLRRRQEPMGNGDKP